MSLIDNVNHLLGDDLKDTLMVGNKLKIAASCFSIYAYEALKKELSKVDSLEFIFTSPTFVAESATDKLQKERREFFIAQANRERSLYGSEFEIQLRNKLTQKAIARECADWIQRKATFRSNRTQSPMQQFAHVSGGQADVAYSGLQGFTAADLGYQRSDAVSNFVTRSEDAETTRYWFSLFDQIWHDPEQLEDVTQLVTDHIASVYAENSPERIYFILLYNIFSEFLDDMNEDVLPNDRTGYQDSQIWGKLFNFQKDAATGIINKLETYNGCILADSVGLGKTFTALAVVKYYELRNKKVLVLAPKKLADNWLNYVGNLTTNIFDEDRFGYDVLAHTDLSRTSGESFGKQLNRIRWSNYDLVVIDESHNFRNNDAFKEKETRYQRLMNKVIRGGVKTKVLMLSATPVNNQFNDLKNQLALAYEGDAENLNSKLNSNVGVEEIFRRAQSAFNVWSKLPPERRTAKSILDSLDFDFFELLDSVTISRSRKHIQAFYDTTDIGSFPNRLKPISIHSPLTDRGDVMDFNEIFEQLKLLNLAVYAPISYVLKSRLPKYEAMYDSQTGGAGRNFRQVDRERSLQSLMTTNLLKRLESSIESFRLTLRHLKDTHVDTLDVIESFQAGNSRASASDFTEGLGSLDADDDDFGMPEDVVPEDVTIGKKIKISLADMDLVTWKQELSVDLVIIDALLESMDKITPEDDVKLQHLKRLIRGKIDKPLNPGNRKVLVFSAFADTANYLYENLAGDLGEENGLQYGRVTGKDAPKSTLGAGYDFQSILTLFSPRSKDKALVLPDEPGEIDVLIGTDCISEGQNLQDCDYLINYDIHWNPVRIIQRFGRIDRIGSINKTVQLVNFWPDISLDEYINLKERVENRMVIADLTATGDDNVLTPQSSDALFRKEQLQKLQEEVIELEDVKTGVSITDLGLNDFRMDLLAYVKENGDLRSAPLGLHAVVPARPERGLEPGVIFALRNLNEGVEVNRHNRLHPYYLVYLSNDGEVVADHSEVKKLLDLIRMSCRGQSNPIADVCRVFNQGTNEGRDMSAYSALLSAAIRSMIDVKEDKDLDSLFAGGKTTALINTISGLDDFELVAFLVVQDVAA